MVLTALRGAVGFLTRIPLGYDEEAWEAFAATPTAMPIVGYLVGAILLLPFLAGVAIPELPATSIAIAFVATIYLVTGITHLDGVADLGDAAVVHGDQSDRRQVLKDSLVGTGGALAIGLMLVGLVTAALAIAELPLRALGIVVATEVGAKASMALLVCLGSPAFEGLGSALTDNASRRRAIPVFVVSAPAAVLVWPLPIASTAAMVAAFAVGGLVYAWARAALGGLNGDVLGATNELARVAALHVGVIAWTLS